MLKKGVGASGAPVKSKSPLGDMPPMRGGNKPVPKLERLTPEAQALVAQHAGLTIWVAKHYFRGHIPDDVISVGHLGLVEAGLRFDPTRNIKFQTYAVNWVRARVLDYLVSGDRIIKYGTRRAERTIFFHLREARAALGEYERDDPEALAAVIGRGITAADVAENLPRVARRDDSVDRIVSSMGAQGSARDREVEVHYLSTPATAEDALAEEDEREKQSQIFRRALAQLDPRARRVVRARYLTDAPRSLADLGDALGVSRERVRQIEVRAIADLKKLVAREDR